MNDPDHSEPTPGSPLRATILAAVAAGVMAAVLKGIPGVELHLLAQAAARVAGILLGSVVSPVADGYALPHAGTPLVVTALCSAADFSCLVAALISWRLARTSRPMWLGFVAAVGAAVPVTVLVNALRIVALCRVHESVIPRLPPSCAGFVHLATGVAVFLPALIALNIALQAHDHRNPVRTS